MGKEAVVVKTMGMGHHLYHLGGKTKEDTTLLLDRSQMAYRLLLRFTWELVFQRTLKVMGRQSKMKTNQRKRMKKLNESRREEEEAKISVARRSNIRHCPLMT
ncbi:hypothetical protein E2C01_053665 [Portunus trituberculatus]|uniref:Uncharacterized protein n=1 Tax=Portunus trituberculatus TaxID=210409 RepID=A0A5B7GHR8_PORTR|nr:hypothetical protein [Portunus trituberculatus]